MARRAEKEGFYCKPFNYKLFVLWLLSIKVTHRQRNEMKAHYRESVEEKRLDKYYDFEEPECQLHSVVMLGSFRVEGHKQGEIRRQMRG